MLRSYSLLALCLLSLPGAGFAAEAQPSWSWGSPTSWLSPVRNYFRATPARPVITEEDLASVHETATKFFKSENKISNSAPRKGMKPKKKKLSGHQKRSRNKLKDKCQDALIHATLVLTNNDDLAAQITSDHALEKLLVEIGLLITERNKSFTPQDVAKILLLQKLTPEDAFFDTKHDQNLSAPDKQDTPIAKILRNIIAPAEPAADATPISDLMNDARIDSTGAAPNTAKNEGENNASLTEDGEAPGEATSDKAVATADSVPTEHPRTPTGEEAPEESEGSNKADEGKERTKEIASNDAEEVVPHTVDRADKELSGISTPDKPKPVDHSDDKEIANNDTEEVVPSPVDTADKELPGISTPNKPKPIDHSDDKDKGKSIPVAPTVTPKPTPKVLTTPVIATPESSNTRMVVKALPATPASTETQANSPQKSRINSETVAGSSAFLLGLTLLSIVFTNKKSRMAFLSWLDNQEVPNALNRSPEELIARYGERKSAILLTAIGLIAMGGGAYGISRGLSTAAAA